MRYFKILISAAALFLASCIENDIPYPVIKLNISSMTGEGFTTSIDVVNRVVTLTLDEQTDIQAVKITEAEIKAEKKNMSEEELASYAAQATLSEPLTGTFDMRSPRYVTLSLYQDYEWTIVAVQQIERAFTVGNQYGSTLFDVENRAVKAEIEKGSDLTNVTVTSMKLGPADVETVYSPTLEELSGTSFETVRFVDVTYHGRTERWILQVTVSDISVSLTQADAWSCSMHLYGEGIAGHPKGFRYRKEGETTWAEVPNIITNGGSFEAHFTVEPLTTYQVLAYCDDDETEPKTLTTEGVMQLPNSGFEDWSQPKKPWLPYLSDTNGGAINPFWASGNNGSTALSANDNITTPVTQPRPGSAGQYSARLESRFIAGQKIAAGNIFTGEFYGVRHLSHGVVNFGRPFTLRPTALRIRVKYNCGTVNRKNNIHTPPDTAPNIGDPDIGCIYIALGTWTKEEYGYVKESKEQCGTDQSPVSIDTFYQSTFFNPNGKDVIAYEERLFTSNVDKWTQITIPLTYKMGTDKVPTHIIVVCSASRYGDYFIGSDESVMLVDDAELIYDEDYSIVDVVLE